MIELMQMHPTGKDIKSAIPVYVVTKEGKDYTSKGIDYIKSSLNEEFDETNDLNIITGQSINSPKVFKAMLQRNMNAYIVLSTKDNVIFIPPKNNGIICENIDESLQNNPKITSWEIIMTACKQTLY